MMVQDQQENKETHNCFIECSPEKKDKLIPIGRIYVHFASCKIINYLGVGRCFKCQCYGHIVNNCDKKKSSCSHCSKEGHAYAECKRNDKQPASAASRLPKSQTILGEQHRIAPYM